MKNLYSVLKYILLAGVLLTIACPDTVEPLPNPCDTSPCPDLAVQLLGGDKENVHVQVTNVGNQEYMNDATVRATFSTTGHVQSVDENFKAPFAIGESKTSFIKSGWLNAGGEPNSLTITVMTWLDEPNKSNNTLSCSWNDNGQIWGCVPALSTVVAQTGASELAASNPSWLLESKKIFLKGLATPSALEGKGGFTGRFIGQANGIGDTFAIFGVEFIGSVIGMDFLPGMKLRACGRDVSVFPFVEAANTTVTDNGFTTGPLETNNKDATVILSGNLSADGQTLDLTLNIDQKDCNIDPIPATAPRVRVPMDLTLTLGSHPNGAFVGQNLKYGVTIRNNGLVTAQDAVLSATIPASLTLLEPGGVSCTPSGDNQICLIPIARIDPGNSITLDFSFNTINVKTKVLTTSFDLVVEGDATLDIVPSDNILAVSYPVAFVSDFSTGFSIVEPPTTLRVGEDTTITLATTVKNVGPSSPLSAVLKGTASAPTDSTAVPDQPTIELLDLAAPRTVLQTYTVNCGERGNHSFSFTTDIQPLNPTDLDPELSNNKATTALDVNCIFVSDFSTSFSVVEPPTTLRVGEDTTITLATTVKNIGSSRPLSAVLKGTASAPADSTIAPSELTIELPDLATPRTVQRTYTVNCGEVGNHSFNFTADIQPLNPADLDPELSNNKATTALDVECVFPVKLDSPGWHLFSMPAVPQAKQTEKFLSEIAGRYSIVLSFEKDGLSYDPALPSFSTLTTMDGEHGYWIYMEQEGFLPVRGQPQALDTPITLEKGWNLVSYLPRTPLSVAQALVSITGKYDKVLGYDQGATSYYPALPAPLNTLQVMERGKGYWIHMIEAGVLDYSKSNAVVQSAVAETPNRPQYTNAIGVTSRWVNIYSTNSIRNGLPLAVGTTVTAVGEDGRWLGQVMVREPGWYGVLAVYGADESDSGFRGARVGEKIRFLIDGEPATISNGIEPTWTTNGDLLQVDLTITAPEMNQHLYLPLVKQ